MRLLCLCVWEMIIFPGRIVMNMNTTITDDVRPPSPGGLAGTILRDLWRVYKPLIVFEAAFKGAVITLGALGTAWVISPLIASTGRAAVTNTDIARFLLSPAGSLAAILLAFSMMLGTMIEHVGVMAIAALHLRGRTVTLAETVIRIEVGRAPARLIRADPAGSDFPSLRSDRGSGRRHLRGAALRP